MPIKKRRINGGAAGRDSRVSESASENECHQLVHKAPMAGNDEVSPERNNGGRIESKDLGRESLALAHFLNSLSVGSNLGPANVANVSDQKEEPELTGIMGQLTAVDVLHREMKDLREGLIMMEDGSDAPQSPQGAPATLVDGNFVYPEEMTGRSLAVLRVNDDASESSEGDSSLSPTPPSFLPPVSVIPAGASGIARSSTTNPVESVRVMPPGWAAYFFKRVSSLCSELPQPTGKFTAPPPSSAPLRREPSVLQPRFADSGVRFRFPPDTNMELPCFKKC